MGGPTSGAGNLGRLDGLEREERLARLQMHGGLTTTDIDELAGDVPLGFDAADQMIENAIGVLGLPLGLGVHVRVNGRDHAVPMAVEEPSVIAAASRAARLVRDAGGFDADADPGIMIGQIHVLGVPDPEAAAERVRAAEPMLLAAADAVHPEHGAARRRGARARSARAAGRVVRAGAGGPRPRRCRRRHGRERDQHAGRGARAGGRGHRRRCDAPADPLEPGRPPRARGCAAASRSSCCATATSTGQRWRAGSPRPARSPRPIPTAPPRTTRAS